MLSYGPAPLGECARLDEATPASSSEYIDHKRIREEALQAAALFWNAQGTYSAEYVELFAYSDRIPRTGLPGPHVKNIGGWFYKAFLRDARQLADLAAHQEQKIGKNGMRIVSDVVLDSRRRQLASQKQYADQQELCYVDENGREICIAFSDIWNTPEKRAAKHYVRARGLEKYCCQLGLKGFFVTLTLPSEYHPNPSDGANSWAGLTPKEGHDEMQRRWRTFQRRFGKTVGIRVEEQHSDGCIHWHSLVWISSERAVELTEKIKQYFGVPPATKIDEIDLIKASAATYLMKYILKATGAHHEGADNDMRNTAACSDAHRATWGGRSIVFFDVAGSSTVWDEVRRIKVDSAQYQQLSERGKELHHSAINNDYCAFLLALQAMNRVDKKSCSILYGKVGTGSVAIKGLVIEEEQINTHNKKWKCRSRKKHKL